MGHDDFIRFWGVRGSIPAPGPTTQEVGGNTSCVEVQLAGERLILDGGSGLRQLGEQQGTLPIRATMLFSHLHWDHIQGLPFFIPLYHPESNVGMRGPKGLREALVKQMSGPTFPIGLDAFNATLDMLPVSAGARWAIGQVQVETCALNHPGGGIGYRLSAGERSVVYACDHEHALDGLDEGLLQLALGADVLIYDAQYMPAEHAHKRGWGHSTYEAGARLARAAGVGRLVLTHHDPARDDAQVRALEARAQRLFDGALAAREGLRLTFSERATGLEPERVHGVALS